MAEFKIKDRDYTSEETKHLKENLLLKFTEYEEKQNAEIEKIKGDLSDNYVDLQNLLTSINKINSRIDHSNDSRLKHYNILADKIKLQADQIKILHFITAMLAMVAIIALYK